MKKISCLAIGLTLSFAAFAQTNPANSFFTLPASSKTIRVYQSAFDGTNTKTIDRPDTSVYNFWPNSRRLNYHFKTDISYTFPDNKKKFIRITIPADFRWDPVTEKPISDPKTLANYDHPEKWKKNGDFVDSQDFNCWLWIPEDEFKPEPYYLSLQGSWVFSGIITPLKYRFRAGGHGTSLLNGDVNLGTFIGYRFLNHPGTTGLSMGAFGGVSSLPMNSSNNTNSIFKSSSSGSTGSTTTNTNNTGLNYGGALVLDVSKKFQVGLIAGWDHAVGDISNGYIYQDRMWLGFSLNFKFLDFGSTGKDPQGAKAAAPANKGT
jgi:hypothetical protein